MVLGRSLRFHVAGTPGKYSPRAAPPGPIVDCTPCTLSGSWSGTGAANYSLCSAGQYARTPERNGCIACAPGKYSPINRPLDACLYCDNGYVPNNATGGSTTCVSTSSAARLCGNCVDVLLLILQCVSVVLRLAAGVGCGCGWCLFQSVLRTPLQFPVTCSAIRATRRWCLHRVPLPAAFHSQIVKKPPTRRGTRRTTLRP